MKKKYYVAWKNEKGIFEKEFAGEDAETDAIMFYDSIKIFNEKRCSTTSLESYSQLFALAA